MAITEKYVSSAGAGAHDGSSEANAFSWAEMITDINAGSKAGNRYNVKKDATYSRTTTLDTISGDGTVTSPVIIRGYNSVITDGYQGRNASGGDLVLTNMPVITYTTGRLNGGGGGFLIFESLNVTSAASNPTLTIDNDCVTVRCKVVNSSTNAGAVGLSAATRDVIYDNDIALTGASGGSYALSMGSGIASNNKITGGPAGGINCTPNLLCVIINNLIYDSAAIGINLNSTATSACIYGNTIVGCGGDGINSVTGKTILTGLIANNMITDGSAYGYDGVSADTAIVMAYNRTRDNSSGADNLATDWLAATKYGQVTTDTGGAETDYTNAGSDDYTLIAASPAKGAGNWSHTDIGALQREESGGASSIMGNNGMDGGFNG